MRPLPAASLLVKRAASGFFMCSRAVVKRTSRAPSEMWQYGNSANVVELSSGFKAAAKNSFLYCARFAALAAAAAASFSSVCFCCLPSVSSSAPSSAPSSPPAAGFALAVPVGAFTGNTTASVALALDCELVLSTATSVSIGFASASAAAFGAGLLLTVSFDGFPSSAMVACAELFGSGVEPPRRRRVRGCALRSPGEAAFVSATAPPSPDTWACRP
mmetsp:Transcript_18523/g.63121  ORF Transcript_18523/g.63121 Transcript_18523/m.63121 type:complete len:217 (+) Transcript_18523:362-1012(+)